ncbi:MAG: NAD(P)H-binding protein [Betaproteobacteria bacterium]|nr:MAG: NAD(P)H-binding protein [Betaproteobacteria bacterium]
MDVMLVGATGVVGREVLSAVLDDSRFSRVVALTRRPLDEHAKLLNPVVDFSRLAEDAPWWRVDAVICTLGTTIKVAGSQAAFAAVDRELPIRIARLARQAGATRFALNSALGASHSGNFYLRTKAEAENGIRAVGFPYYTIVRPSLIDAKREQSRPGEFVGIIVARILKPLIPRRYRAVTPDRIAHALIAGVLAKTPGECIIESEQLQS